MQRSKRGLNRPPIPWGGVVLLLFCPAFVLPTKAQQEATKPASDTRTPEQKESDGLINAGKQAYLKGEISAALTAFEGAKEKATAAKDPRRIANALHLIGVVYNAQGQIEKSLDFHLQALAIQEKENDQPGIALSLNSLGGVYREIGEVPKALEALQRAQAIYRTLKDKEGLARSYNSLGNLYQNTGEMEKSLDAYQQSLALTEKSGSLQDTAFTLNNLGILYVKMGQLEQGLLHYQRALKIKETLGNERSLANTLNSLGILSLRQDETDQALLYHQKALTIRERLRILPEIAESLCNLGNVETTAEHRAKALEYYQKALAIRENLDNPLDLATSLNNLAVLYPSLGEPEKALDCCRKAQAIYEKSGSPVDIASVLANQGSIYAKMNRIDEALSCDLRALRILEELSLQVDDPTELGNFQHSNLGDLYPFIAELLSRKKPTEALLMLERGRAQGLARQLSSADAFDRLLSVTDREQMQRLQNSLGRTATELRDISHQPTPINPEKKKGYEQAKSRATTAYSNALIAFTHFREQIYSKPGYTELRHLSGIHPPQQTELLELSRSHPNTLYLEYAQVDEKAFLRAILQDGYVRFERISCPVKTLTQQIQNWRTEITRADAYDRTKEEALAQSLYKLLLSGIKLNATQNLVIVAEKGWLDVPFVALRDEQGKRLIETCAVSSAFSLHSLTWTSPDKKVGHPPLPLLCLADPTGLNGQTYQSTLRGGFGALPRAREEGKAISELIPGSKMLVGAQVREATIKAEMSKYDLLHFATHGIADSHNGLLSGLILAPEPPDSREDGILFAKEIAGMRLKARLVVLSACETARGQASGGEGLLGLGWAFRAAGVPAIIASQWRVDDLATEMLMIKLYRGLRTGQSKDTALRNAILSVKQKHANPFYWAAFQTIGDQNSLKR